MKINRITFLLMICLGITYSSVSLATDQISPISNMFKQMETEKEVNRYESAMRQALEDLKENGIYFTGQKTTRVKSSDEPNKVYLKLEIEVKLKREIINKYTEIFSTFKSKFIWDQALLRLNKEYNSDGAMGNIIFSTNGRPHRFFYNLKLLDFDKNAISTQILTHNSFIGLSLKDFLSKSSIFKNQNGILIRLDILNSDSEDIVLSTYYDISFLLDLKSMEKVDSFSFSVVDNPDYNK